MGKTTLREEETGGVTPSRRWMWSKSINSSQLRFFTWDKIGPVLPSEPVELRLSIPVYLLRSDSFPSSRHAHAHFSFLLLTQFVQGAFHPLSAETKKHNLSHTHTNTHSVRQRVSTDSICVYGNDLWQRKRSLNKVEILSRTHTHTYIWMTVCECARYENVHGRSNYR